MSRFLFIVGLAALVAAVACGTDFSNNGSGGAGASASSSGTGAHSSSSSSSSSSGSSGQGGAECAQAGECPFPSTSCVRPTCNAGKCGEEAKAAGPLPDSFQTLGDCVTVACDGNGTVVETADNTDVPDDGNDCTIDGCGDKEPYNNPAPSGSPCAGGLTCDGSGNCVGCSGPGDCGVSTFCLLYSCNSQQCIIGYTTANTPLLPADQNPGDCQNLICDGAGNAVPVPDDTDVPADPVPHDCEEPTCVNGQVASKAVDDLSLCGPQMSRMCCGGQCCDTNGDCTAPTNCGG